MSLVDRDLRRWQCKRYRVTSIHRVLGHEPGVEFDASLTDQQEFSLLDSGAIAVVEAYKEPGVTPATRTRTPKRDARKR